MREIKFRAWDKERGKMHAVGELDHNGFVTFKIGHIWHSPQEVEVMQFTGLRDKNGKEIYEGDVVVDRDCVWIVEWDASQWVETLVIDQLTDVKFNIEETVHSEEIEVVGNIYENPELVAGGGE